MAIIVVAFLLSTFLMYEGRSARRSPRRNADGSMNDYEVAKINGRSLMRSELERRLRDYLSSYSSRSAESLDMSAIYQAVLDQAVLEAQLAKEVEEKGGRVSDADADRAMKEYADRYYPTRETFYQALANSGVKVEDYRRSLARRMATEQVIRDAIGEVEVSEDKVVEFYESAKDIFYTRPEGYWLHVADFNTSDDAEYLRAKLEAGESWDVIVSKDELASVDVINITREPIYVPATTFSVAPYTALASLDVGEVSPVFAVSSADYAVGLKIRHLEREVRPYDEVSGDIKSMLLTQEERRRLTEFETALRGRAQLVINDEELFARPAANEEPVPEVEDVIPELAEPNIETEAPAHVEETKPETEDKPEIEADSVVEEVKEDTDTPETIKEVEAEAEAPAVVEEAEPAEQIASEAEETETETEAPVTETEETPAIVEEVVASEEITPAE